MDDGSGGKSMFHIRSGMRNCMLLDAGPLVSAPQPTPLKNIVKPVEQGGGPDDKSLANVKAGKGGKGKQSAADPLAEPKAPLTAEPTAAPKAKSVAGDPMAEGGGGDGESGANEEEDMLEPEPGKVYISHKWSVNSQEWIQKMLAEFDAAGVNYMQSDMSDSYIDAVEFHIARCEYVVLLVTKEYAAAVHNSQARSHKEVRCACSLCCALTLWEWL